MTQISTLLWPPRFTIMANASARFLIVSLFHQKDTPLSCRKGSLNGSKGILMSIWREGQSSGSYLATKGRSHAIVLSLEGYSSMRLSVVPILVNFSYSPYGRTPTAANAYQNILTISRRRCLASVTPASTEIVLGIMTTHLQSEGRQCQSHRAYAIIRVHCGML